MTDAFCTVDGDRFTATEWTRGSWDASSQHAGPPAALLEMVIESLAEVADHQVARTPRNVCGAC